MVEGAEEGPGIGMIPDLPAHLRVPKVIVGCDHEGAAGLPRISRDLHLPEAFAQGVERAADDGRVERDPEPAPESRCAIRRHCIAIR